MIDFDSLNIIGSDETGVGDYLTPLVACSVFTVPEVALRLKALGVQDSKKLSDLKIKQLAMRIKPMVKYSVNHVSQKGYNNLNKMNNAHWIKMFLHLKGINYLERIIEDKIDYVFIDAFSNEKSMNKYETELVENKYFDFVEIQSNKMYLQKGESLSIAVACASIIARDHLLYLISAQNKKFNITTPLGVNKNVELFALNLIKKHGREILYDLAKVKFKTTEKIKQMLLSEKKNVLLCNKIRN